MATKTSPAPEIVLITASVMPKPDLDSGLLVEELEKLNVHASILPWDAAFDWSAVPLVVLRTPWDYWRRIDAFLNWASQVDGKTKLLNPAGLVRWNAHKSYLLDLENRGVPIVPTQLLRAADTPRPSCLPQITESDTVVIKRAVGAGAVGAMRGSRTDPMMTAHLGELLQAGDALVQPFVPSVADLGEASLIYFEGRYSHSIRKRPAEGDYRVQNQHGGTLHPHTPTSQELEVASAALAAAPEPAAYARVDLVEYEGRPLIMELEMIEPELFLRCSKEGTQNFARNLKGLLKI